MPSKGTKVRSLRVHDDVWIPAQAQAMRDGIDLATLIRTWLTVYGRPRAPRPAKR
jgi:hypothetical protein